MHALSRDSMFFYPSPKLETCRGSVKSPVPKFHPIREREDKLKFLVLGKNSMTGPGLGGTPTLRSETRLFGPCSLSV